MDVEICDAVQTEALVLVTENVRIVKLYSDSRLGAANPTATKKAFKPAAKAD